MDVDGGVESRACGYVIFLIRKSDYVFDLYCFVLFYSVNNNPMLAKALGALGTAMLLLLMFAGWGLLILSVAGYAGSSWGFSISKHQQVWASVVGLVLCGYQTFYWFKATMGRLRHSYLPLQWLHRFLLNVGAVIKKIYGHIFQAVDVLFCIGGPMLVVTALVGWWMVDEVNGSVLLLYLLLIGIIGVIGIYNNLVRMLAIGYFNGYWLVDDNMLSYPFVAPLRVYGNINIVGLETVPLPWLLAGMALLLLVVFIYCTRRRVLLSSNYTSLVNSVFIYLSKVPQRTLMANLLLLLIVMLSVLPLIVTVTWLIPVINIHCFYAAIVIWILDSLWCREFEEEPALCGDCRYLFSGDWRP